MREIGLTVFETAFLNSLSAISGLIAAPITGVVAHKLNKYQSLLVLCLLGSTVAYTGLLFVPRVIWTPRHPSIIFDCTNKHLRMESCADWDGQCNLKPKMPAMGNFTNFSLTKCKYVCPSSPSSSSSSSISAAVTQESFNASLYPLQVCFGSSSEGSMCLLHDPAQADKGSREGLVSYNESKSRLSSYQDYQLIEFDSRFDRWPVVSLRGDSECLFQATAPLIVNHKTYDTVSCRPIVHNCLIHCKVNLVHRPRGSAAHLLPKSPTPCHDLDGNPKITFYAYLAVRSFADLFLFVAFNLLDGLSITLTNNFDNLYGGIKKTRSMALPMFLTPFFTGFLVDFYSSQAGQPDYAPPFILFDGFMLITVILVLSTPSSSPNSGLNKNVSQSTASLRSTPSLRVLRQKQKIPLKNWLLFFLAVVPLTLWSGMQWSVLQTHLFPFYIDLGVDKTWLGISFSLGFLFLLPLSLLGKNLVSGIGRLHLILLAFIFYALRFTAISFLTLFPKWILLPLESLAAFTLPLTWIGITSYAHFLIKTTLRIELMSRTGMDPSNNNHIKMQYFLNFLHFGLGRVIGSGLWSLWILHWESSFNKRWEWLTIHDEGFPENDSDGFRVLLRLMAIISAGIALPVLFFHHIMGRIVDCLQDIIREIKQSIICVKDVFVKCFALLCCCSCSCKLAKCRLCRRRRTYSIHDEEEEEERINEENQEIEANNSEVTRVTKSRENSAQTTGGHPLHSQNTTSPPNGSAVRTGSQYTRLFDHSVTSPPRTDMMKRPPKQSNGNQPGVHFTPSTTSSHHRPRFSDGRRSTSPPVFETELRSTGREVSHQRFLRQPVIGRSPRHTSSHAVKSITPGFVGLEGKR